MFKALSDGHRALHAHRRRGRHRRDPTPPCGACRQMLWEFGGDIEIVLANLTEVTGRHQMAELLPLPFDGRSA